MDAETDSNCTYNRYCTNENEDTPRLSIAGPEEWRDGIVKLIASPAPKGITHTRWRQFIQDAEHFMTDWAEKASALEWTALEVFGVHPLAPAHRPDAAGLVWLLNGNEIAAITADRAIIKTMTGNSQTLVKGVTGSVEAWRLAEENKLS